MDFEHWLGQLFGRDHLEARRVLQDRSALHFLIAWSVFEAKCFDGFVKIDRLEQFSARLVSETFDAGLLASEVQHFHARYQDAELYRQLMHGQPCNRMEQLLRRDVGALEPDARIFLVALVSYRFRNNMFHGNKGVESWLRYRPQIQLCTSVLQSFITHAEAIRPSIAVREVA